MVGDMKKEVQSLFNHFKRMRSEAYVKNEKYQEALVVMKEDKQETHSQVYKKHI